MTSEKKTILIGEDDFEVCGYLEMATKCMGDDVIIAHDGHEVLECLERNQGIDAVVLDVMMPRKDGIETLQRIRAMDGSLPVIMISDVSSTMNVVQAMKIGASDFLSKPVTYGELRDAIQRIAGSKSQVVAANEKTDAVGTSGKLFFGTSRRMHNIRQTLTDIAASDVPVLIRGETGTGKEMIARELHAVSPRSQKPFLKLNCAALPSELVESELFGYERGAFTGAVQKKLGMFELADGGTILLDEIGDMDFKLQAKLLQVLQDHEFHRIGGKATIRVDVRVLAATHRDLEHAIVNRQFREDLYYRLNVITVDLPALRERKEDIVPMADFLIQKNRNPTPPLLTPAMKQAFLEYDWPGNVRELDNVIRRFLVLRDHEGIIRELKAKMVRKEGQRIDTAPPESDPILAQVSKAKSEAETTAILGALSATRWNRKHAARLLNIDYKALLYKMKKLGIDDRGMKMNESLSEPVLAAAG